MTKKDFILNNEAIATHDYYRIQIHGIEGEHAYIARLYQPTYCGSTKASFHKVKIYTDKDGDQYVRLIERTYDGRRKSLYLGLNHFIRKASGWCTYSISCEELKAIC